MPTITSEMLLAFDTSSAACTAALFDGSGACLGQADEMLGRGHAERLVPMLAKLLDGRAATQLLVGVGPGSFTGIRVGIAAAQGLAIGWDASLRGMSSLALLAASATAREVAVAVKGGHGELFVQQFDRLKPIFEVHNADPASAARLVTCELIVGSGAQQLVEARGWGDPLELWPSAANTLRLPQLLRSLSPKPVYARAPDARVPEAA